MIGMDVELQRLSEEARRRLPQALHELRKLNAIVKQGAEKLVSKFQSEDAEQVAGAAQLMSNVFGALEVLTNMEDLVVSIEEKLEFIHVFDLAYKAKKIYQVRAALKPMSINVEGDDRVGILGSKKYFPLVVQTLLDNAIKYGRKGTTIKVRVIREGESCRIAVENQTDQLFDPSKCFEKGVRFADSTVEGDGLGLYLAREVVRAHKGRIWAECNAGLARLVVSLPAAVATSSAV